MYNEFERKVDIQNNSFGWSRFKSRFFLNHQITTAKKRKKNSTVN